jgi:hypothetical protein
MSEIIHNEAAGEDLFYRAFEEEFRGSRELIKSRLVFYLPFIEPLKQTQPCPKAVDLGCGRGEWLEILAENGFSALVLLRHKTDHLICLMGREQHGHRERRRVSAMMSRRLMVAIEFGM